MSKDVRTLYRDGIEQEIVGPIRVSHNGDGHTIESYRLANGSKGYFVTLSGTHWCAHGSTVAEAVADAIWKDPAKRPPIEKLVGEIKAAGTDRPITLHEFRHITGACLAGCKEALERAGMPSATAMVAKDIMDKVSKEWGMKLIRILGWEGQLL